MDGFKVRVFIPRGWLHGVREAVEGEEDWGEGWAEDFGEEEGEDCVGDWGVGGAEGGEAGEGDVGGDGDGDLGGGGGGGGGLGELVVGEVGVCGEDLAEEAGVVVWLDVGGWGGGGEGGVGCVADCDVLGCFGGKIRCQFDENNAFSGFCQMGKKTTYPLVG